VTNQTQTINLPIKAVPDASKDHIAGMLGDRLKVRISAPAENGKANKAICTLIAKALNIKSATVKILTGHTNPEKTLQITNSPYPTTQQALNQLSRPTIHANQRKAKN